MIVGHAHGDPVSGPSSKHSSYHAPSNAYWHLCIFSEFT